MTSFNRGPNVFHPEKAGAVGSRNSLNRHGRDEYLESQTMVDEEVDKILNHIHSKLPPEALSRLHVSGNLKDKLHNYYNQSFQNMYNRYITTVEDELAKKFRLLVDKEEFEALNRYTPKEISKLLTQIGGDDKFNSAETEKSLVNIYGHLQGHIQRGVHVLEHLTNNLLRQKTDVGAFVRGENSYAIVKCSISDSIEKPQAVSDINLTLNITANELISPIYHSQILSNSIIKDIVSNKIMDDIDQSIETISTKRLDQGEEELRFSEATFERIKHLDNYFDEENEDHSGKYSITAKRIFEVMENVDGFAEAKEQDPLSVKKQVIDSLNKDNIRTRGFNTAINSICNILDTSRLGYQHLENFKNAKKVVISEYKNRFRSEDPDESFGITIEYLDPSQLREKRLAYQQQIAEFENEIEMLEKVVEGAYVKRFVNERELLDYERLHDKIMKPEPVKNFFGRKNKNEEEEEEEEKLWNELTFIQGEKTNDASEVPTFANEFLNLKRKIKRAKEKINGSFANEYSEERIAFEERVDFLDKSISKFNAMYNPFHCNPGLMLSVNMKTIKRQLRTMTNMSNVLNEFLFGLSKGFSDKAFASFSRRRSTDKTLTDEEWRTINVKKDDESAIEGVAEL